MVKNAAVQENGGFVKIKPSNWLIILYMHKNVESFPELIHSPLSPIFQLKTLLLLGFKKLHYFF